MADGTRQVKRTDRARQWTSTRVGSKRAVSSMAARAHAAGRRIGIGNRYPLQIADYTLRIAEWPEGTYITVAALADLHFGGSYFNQQRLDVVIEETNSLDPDLVVLLGDYGASHLEGPSHRVAMRRLATSLTRLQAPLGLIAVLSNHDWWDDPDAQGTGATRSLPHKSSELPE